MYPFKLQHTLDLCESKIASSKRLGHLNNTFKLQILRHSLEGDLKTTIKLFRGLMSPTESFFLISKYYRLCEE